PDMTVEGADVNQPPQPQAEQSTTFKAAAAHRRSPDRAARLRERSSIRRLAERDSASATWTLEPFLRGMSNNGSVKLQTEQGRLVDDKLVSDSETWTGLSARAGFVLDGFPRTIGQAERLDSMLAERSRQLDAVVQLDLSPSWRPKRVTGRLYHLPSGRVYHHRVQSAQASRTRQRDWRTAGYAAGRLSDVMQRRLASHFRVQRACAAALRAAGL
uniref:ADK_lid domain-containing protein n=1 Tax=Macrostomum lignano TaxID=282301 RepID=A0A1I8FPY5_9PLAT